jgi:GT2 family glycosyltransferase
MTNVSLITVNYRCRELLQRLFDSTASLNDWSAAEWIVVDNSPVPERLQETLRLPPPLERMVVIENPHNPGFGAGCNLGAARAVGEILFFINPDCQFTGGSFSSLVNRLRQEKHVAAIGPRLVDSAGNTEFSGLPFPGIITEAWVKGQKRLVSQPWIKSQVMARFNKYRKVDWVTGGALLTSREAFAQVGGFDEEYFLYFEDVDLCFRWHLQGREILYDPGFTVIHDHGGTAAASGQSIQTHYRKSQLRYYRKHKKLLSVKTLELYLRLTGRYPS